MPGPGSNRLSTRTSKPGRQSDVGIDSATPKEKSTTDEKLDDIYNILSTLISKDCMDIKLNKLKHDITEENRELIERLEGRIFDLESENEDLKMTVGRLERQIVSLHEKQIELDCKQNDLEQHGRKNSIRIIGIEDKEEKESVEMCVEKVVNFVKDHVKVPLDKSEIDIAHRLGKFGGDKPRSIIVKFTHRRKKSEIIRARKNLKGTGFTIFEDLTRFNQERLTEAYKLKCVKSSYSFDGKLFLVLQNGKKRKLSYDTLLDGDFLLDDANFTRI